MKIAELRTVNRRHPAAKVLVALVVAMVATVGTLAISKGGGGESSDLAEWQKSTEMALARQLEVENEVSGVGEVTNMPGVADVGEGREEPVVSTPATEKKTTPQRVQAMGNGGLVALTFDDGPGAHTGRLLDILREKDAKATFFMLGSMAEKRQDVVRRVSAEGHEIGSHTMNHKNFNQIDVGAVEWEITRSREVLEGITGVGVKYIRPPYGIVTDAVRNAGAVVLWSVDPKDWKDRDAWAVRQRVVGGVSDGAIVLLHDIHASTVDAIPGIIDDLRAGGYKMVTLSELFAAKGWEPIKGNIYTRIGG